MGGDATLLAASAGGDRDAFRALFERHAGPVRRYASARVGPDLADDVLVETFEVAWRRCSDFRAAAGSARPWLLGIATRILAAHRHAEVRWQQSIHIARDEYAGVAVGPPTIPAQLDPALVAAIASLGAGEREILALVALGELTVAEAARSIGVTEVAARVRLHRARRTMNRLLERGGTT